LLVSSLFCAATFTACQTNRVAKTTEHQSLQELNITSVLHLIRLEEKERDKWIARVGPQTIFLQEEAKRAKDSVYSDEKYAQDVDVFVNSLLRRLQAVHNESLFYRSWYFRLTSDMLKTNTPSAP
jgi:hypothetical protein